MCNASHREYVEPEGDRQRKREANKLCDTKCVAGMVVKYMHNGCVSVTMQLHHNHEHVTATRNILTPADRAFISTLLLCGHDNAYIYNVLRGDSGSARHREQPYF
jgi:hypothetical protein